MSMIWSIVCVLRSLTTIHGKESIGFGEEWVRSGREQGFV